MKESINNYFLNIYTNIARRLTSKTKQFPPDPWKFFISDFTNFKDGVFERNQWIKRMWWGNYKTNEKVVYIDEDNVINIEGDKPISLITKRNPKINPNTGEEMQFSEGCIMKVEPIRNYGAVEVKVRISPAKGVWHAPLWFVAANLIGSKETVKVLPELDVCELYSEEDPFKMKAKSDIHYGTDYESNSKRKGAKTHYIPNMFSRDISFGLIWEEKCISFYIDGWLVRKITDKSILDRLRSGIIPVINTSIDRKYGDIHEPTQLEVVHYTYFEL